ncbi:MAG: GNAT family N-acetyltransferase [Oscillospiraceae bacterium]|nr:GNAT family N-acetyltransferase [Oscillospiraceae bacterium]
MDDLADKRDDELLESDRYTFYVLRKILHDNNRLLLTDHKSLIICFSGHPYPVWVWTPDDAPADVMDRAYALSKEQELLDGTHTFNIKRPVGEHFIRRAAEEGRTMSVKRGMYAYDCPEPICPKDRADGEMHICTPDDTDAVTEFIAMFHKEKQFDLKDDESYREDAVRFIGSGDMFLWKDGQGEYVASCMYDHSGGMASMHLVYTRPERRRAHYAENLVYRATIRAKAQGFLPTLYTDAGYAASNACYTKIGYILRGDLCNIG